MPEDANDPLDDLARGYIPLGRDARDAVWRDGTVILDANVLLNLYRYSPAARSQLLDVLGRVQNRLWVPNQSASEYFKRRARVLTEQLTAGDQLSARLDTAISALMADLRAVHQGVGRRDLGEDSVSEAASTLERLKDELLRKEAERVPAASLSDDDVHESVVRLIRGRVGPAYSGERLQEISVTRGLCATRTKFHPAIKTPTRTRTDTAI